MATLTDFLFLVWKDDKDSWGIEVGVPHPVQIVNRHANDALEEIRRGKPIDPARLTTNEYSTPNQKISYC